MKKILAPFIILMALIDSELRFQTAQLLNSVGANASTNVIDSSQVRHIGNGKAMGVEFHIDVAADNANADETYAFIVEGSADAAFSTPIEVARRTFTHAEIATKLQTGQSVNVPLPKEEHATVIFYRTNVFTAGTTPSVTVTSELTPQDAIDAENRGGFPSASLIS